MIGSKDDIRDRRSGESYLEYFFDHVDLQTRTEATYETPWAHLERFAKKNDYEIRFIDSEKAEEFCEFLNRNEDLKEEIAEMYVSKISIVVEWLIENGKADYNPYSDFLPSKRSRSDGYFDYDREASTDKLEVDLNELRKAVISISRPELFVYTVLLLKTGIRMAEAVNLDLRDIHLDHPIAQQMPEPRKELINHPDSIYIDSSINEDEIYNGEIRERGNKPDSTRELPFDREVKDTLVWWIAMTTPPSSEPYPLVPVVSNRHGNRIHSGTLRTFLKEWAEKHDFHGENMEHFGVSSHWCRHWFSTLMRARIDDSEVTIGSAKGYVKGLRGDSEEDTIETYTHEWSEVMEDGKSWRKVYEDNVPMLFIDPGEDQRD